MLWYTFGVSGQNVGIAVTCAMSNLADKGHSPNMSKLAIDKPRNLRRSYTSLFDMGSMYALFIPHMGMRDDDIIGKFDDGTEIVLQGHYVTVRMNTTQGMRPFVMHSTICCHAKGEASSNDECVEIETCLSGPKPEPCEKEGEWRWTCTTVAPFRMDASCRAQREGIRRHGTTSAAPWPYGDAYLEHATLYVSVKCAASPWGISPKSFEHPAAVDMYAKATTNIFGCSRFWHFGHRASWVDAEDSAQISTEAFRLTAARMFSVTVSRGHVHDEWATTFVSNDNWYFNVPLRVFKPCTPLAGAVVCVAADSVCLAATLWYTVTNKVAWDPNAAIVLAKVARTIGATGLCRSMIDVMVPLDDMMRRGMCPLLRLDMCPLMTGAKSPMASTCCGSDDTMARKVARCIAENAHAVGMLDAYM